MRCHQSRWQPNRGRNPLSESPDTVQTNRATSNRHGLLVDACLTFADGHAERVAALHMIEPRADRPQAITLGAEGI